MPPTTRSKTTSAPGGSGTSKRKASVAESGASTSKNIRQLRSRTVPIRAAVNATSLPTSNVRPLESSNTVQGSHPPQSGASTRVLEENTCSETNTRNHRRNHSKSRTPSNVRTRSSSRTSRSQTARITLRVKGSANGKTLTASGSTFHGQTQKPLLKSAGRVVGIKGKNYKPILPEEEKTEVLSQNNALVEIPGCECGSFERLHKMAVGSTVEHFLHCEFYSHVCPLVISANCQWTGLLGEAINHITVDHPTVNHKTGPNIQIPIPNWRDASIKEWLTLQTCLGQNFLVVLQKQTVNINQFCKFYAAVKLFGHQKDADRFEFRVALKTSGKPGRTLSYLTVVRALHDGTESLSDGDCFIFDSCQAQLFSLDDSFVLDVSISVTKI